MSNRVLPHELLTIGGHLLPWEEVVRHCIHRRTAAVRIISRLVRRGCRYDQQGLLIELTPATPDHLTLNSATTTTTTFILSTSNDDDIPTRFTRLQRQLAIASLFFSHIHTFEVDTDRCGRMEWNRERDGALGASYATTQICSPSVAGLTAVALLNANLISGQPDGRLSADVTTLTLLRCCDGVVIENPEDGTDNNIRVLEAATTAAMRHVGFLCDDRRDSDDGSGVVSPAVAAATRRIAGGGGVVYSLPNLSGTKELTNMILVVNIDSRRTPCLAAVGEQDVEKTLQKALLQLSSDHMDVFGRLTRLRAMAASAASGSSSHDDAAAEAEHMSMIQCISNAVCRIVMLSRERHARSTPRIDNAQSVGSKRSPFEDRLLAVLMRAGAIKEGDDETSMSCAGHRPSEAEIRFLMEEAIYKARVG